MTERSARHRRRLRRWALGALLVIALAAIGTLAVAAQSTLHNARVQRDQAQAQLDAALAAARAVAMPDGDLTPIVSKEQADLTDTGTGAEWLVFPAPGQQKLSGETAALGGLRDDVGKAISLRTSVARTSAAASLRGYRDAITSAQAVGVDSSADAKIAAADSVALDAATNPAAVAAAVSNISGATSRLADAAATAQQAATAATLADARQHTQASLTALDTQLAAAQAVMPIGAGTVKSVSDQHVLFDAALTPADYGVILGNVKFVAGQLDILTSALADATAALTAGRAALASAAAAGLDTTAASASLTSAGQQVAVADTPQVLEKATYTVNMTVAPFADRLGITLPGGKVIVVSLARQDMTTYQDGVPLMSTYVTTGRPALPTPPGTTSVLSKSSPFHMVSSWPVGTIGWYEPSWVQYVLWFRSGGFGIHDAPWRDRYGPGTDDGNGSHGCINIPGDLMPALFSWADLGTTVIVH